MELITNRTEADVLLGNAKGTYGYTDLNRVEQAVTELCSLATRLDIHQNLTTKTDWGLPGAFSAGTWPTVEQMKRYLGNVHALCDALSLETNLPMTMAHLTFVGANEIENALLSAYHRVQGILNAYQFSGEIYAGEENVI